MKSLQVIHEKAIQEKAIHEKTISSSNIIILAISY